MLSRAEELKLAELETKVASWSNDEVYQYYLFEATDPDSYDGNFTTFGYCQREILEDELTQRLIDAKFITDDWQEAEQVE